MKKVLSITAVLLVAVLAMSLSACSTANEPVRSTEGSGTFYRVGISQLIQHGALDAATQGFKDALTEELGDKVIFDFQNAQGDPNTCASIANGFVASKVDLIMANATPALQAAATATAEIPVLGTSITEYGVALGIENFTGTVGGNVSGTSDLAPLDEQARMITELFPQAETVGLLYCSAEPNSLYQVTTVASHLTEAGLEARMYPFTDSNDLAGIAALAASEVQVLYVPTDNTVASNTGIIDNIFRPAGIPVVTGEKDTCAGCGVATLSIDYYDLGYTTGKMAARILRGEAEISSMPVEYAPNFTRMYNPEICEALSLTMPQDYTPITD
ncbi:MAG TPA: ABC transporter substrate-binding protein [Clostridiaceae bacterium]|nr:ABC transporter substrate-binding protein [Clostridiaceae bacterium]